ncbi:MAG TPA: biotin/lipoate A/B protein ligase family protein [Gemmatimonadota bacterium]|nr:biotin/lipoate A/B protein ligase family protein [Gemmatimonadota bacterium]
MAVDEALMDAAREGRVVLRLYRWDPPCLSFGRNQRAEGLYDLEAARREGIDLVRRPTGGRAVFHHRELTYSVAAPAELWGGLRRSYRRINRALLLGVRRLGASVREAERSGERAPGPGTRACFRDPLPGEITAAGRKLIGSAQWRDRGALLQHGSLILHDDQEVAERLRLGPEEDDPAGRAEEGARAAADGRGSPVRAAALADLLGRAPDVGELEEALRAGFEEAFGVPVRPAPDDLPRAARVRELEERYRDPAWTWRR